VTQKAPPWPLQQRDLSRDFSWRTHLHRDTSRRGPNLKRSREGRSQQGLGQRRAGAGRAGRKASWRTTHSPQPLAAEPTTPRREGQRQPYRAASDTQPSTSKLPRRASRLGPGSTWSRLGGRERDGDEGRIEIAAGSARRRRRSAGETTGGDGEGILWWGGWRRGSPRSDPRATRRRLGFQGVKCSGSDH
jgi:hypothetical protein